jgi:hypothetical protein
MNRAAHGCLATDWSVFDNDIQVRGSDLEGYLDFQNAQCGDRAQACKAMMLTIFLERFGKRSGAVTAQPTSTSPYVSCYEPKLRR